MQLRHRAGHSDTPGSGAVGAQAMASLVIADLRAAAAQRAAATPGPANGGAAANRLDEEAALGASGGVSSSLATLSSSHFSRSADGSWTMHGTGVMATPARPGSNGRELGDGDMQPAGDIAHSGSGLPGSFPDRHYVLFGAVSTATLAVALLLLIGTVTYMHLENLSVVDALYLTTGVITTVGLVVVPRTMAGRAFTAIFNFLSLGIGVLLLTEIAEARRGWTRGVAERVPCGQAVARACASLLSRGFTWLCTCTCCQSAFAALRARRAGGGASSAASASSGQLSSGGGVTAAAAAPSAEGFAVAVGAGSGGVAGGAASPPPLPPATALILSELVWYVASAAPLVIAAAAAFHAIEGWPLWESLYFCLITGSGLGMGDVEPRHWTARLVFCMYVWGNMGAMLGLLGSVGILLHDRANASVAAAARFLPGWCGAPGGQGNSAVGGGGNAGSETMGMGMGMGHAAQAPQNPTSLAARTGGAAGAVVAAAARANAAAAAEQDALLSADTGAAGAGAVPQKLLFSAGAAANAPFSDAESAARSRSRSRQRSFNGETSDAGGSSSEAGASALSAPPTFGDVAAGDVMQGRSSLHRHFSHAPFTLHARGSMDDVDGGAAAFFARAADARDNEADIDAESSELLPPKSGGSE